MNNIRLIARLDIKGPNLIKRVQFEGVRVLGDPQVYAKQYYEQGADEIIYIDAVASLYGRENLMSIVKYTAQEVFVPLTAGGGIRTVQDVEKMLRSGADKVAVNTAAVKNNVLIADITKRFGSQCLVLSVEAKRIGNNTWEPYIDGGRERTHIDVIDWIRKGVDFGAGEILLTSIDQEGTRRGFDINLISAVTEAISVPVIASGGMGTFNHMISAVKEGGAVAVAMADILHYKREKFSDIRKAAMTADLNVRTFA